MPPTSARCLGVCARGAPAVSAAATTRIAKLERINASTRDRGDLPGRVAGDRGDVRADDDTPLWGVVYRVVRMEAPPGFEPGVEVLQPSAFPLGDGAPKSRPAGRHAPPRS